MLVLTEGKVSGVLGSMTKNYIRQKKDGTDRKNEGCEATEQKREGTAQTLATKILGRIGQERAKATALYRVPITTDTLPYDH